MAALYIPGMRVEIRDAEWRIQRVDRCVDGGYLLHCAGLSELVRGRSAQFMSRLEEQMGNAPRVLDPATTELVDDLSGGYRAGQLFIGTALRQTPPTDDCAYIGAEDDTWYDQNGRIAFTPSKGLVGVGLPRKARTADLKDGTHYRIEWHGDSPAPLDVPLPCTLSCAELPQQDALGWDDIKHLPQGFVVIRTSPDETLPDAQGNNTVVPRETRYHAPFVKPDRERDYRLVWEVLA